MLFSEPKIPQFPGFWWFLVRSGVSVLFSEPKIPQWSPNETAIFAFVGFSALQRAENSSIVRRPGTGRLPDVFQCSSASRKFLNPRTSRSTRWFRCRFSALQRAENSSIWDGRIRHQKALGRFSALQRAENSSMRTLARRAFLLLRVSVLFSEPKIPQSLLYRTTNTPRSPFQCSSASRKFLNVRPAPYSARRRRSFSALQRAENSSIRASTSLTLRVG